MKHRSRSQRQPRRKTRSQKRVRAHRRRGVEPIRVDQEIDALLKNGVETGTDEAGRDDGDGPGGSVGIGGPAEEEEAGDEEEAADGHWGESCFWDGFAACFGLFACVVALESEVDEDGAEDADEEAEEGEGGDDGSPFSVFLVDDGEDLEGGVEDRVDEGGVDGYACYHGLGEEHADGSG